MAITQTPDQIKRSVQNILVKSFDEDFNVLAVELVGYDSDVQVLRRLKVNASGEVQLDTTALDARFVNVTGDNLEGNLTADAGVLIDGYDISVEFSAIDAGIDGGTF